MDSKFGISNLKGSLPTASNEQEFLLLLDKVWLANLDEIDALTNELAQLHNEGQIDLIKAFKSLENKPDSEISFYQIRRIFEEVLPKLNANLIEVMECVLYLFKEAGKDLSAGIVFHTFENYCSAGNSRPQEGLELVKDLGDKYIDFLAPVLIAGSRIEFEHYFNEALRLASNDDMEIRRRAIFALGRLQYPEDSDFPGKALEALKSAVTREMDDRLLGHIVEVAFQLYERDSTLDERSTQLIDEALSKGGDFALHKASSLLGLNSKKLSNSLVEILLSHLQRVNPSYRDSLDNIDYGIAFLLQNGMHEKGLAFLEKLLLKNRGNVSLSIFDSSILELLQNRNNILFQLMTRWFLRGNRELCEGITIITQSFHGDELVLSAEPTELDISNADEPLFVARKAIGYLFLKPISAASIVVSLIELASDTTIIQKLSQLLFDPLLINYPRKVSGFLEQQLEVIKEQYVREAIREAIESFESYITDLKSTGEIPELYPSEENKEAYRRHFVQEMSEAMKTVEKESALLSLFPKAVLLYGKKSIDYVHDSSGEARRLETLLQSFGTEVDSPRLENIDPFGLNYMLWIFRTEQILRNEADY